MKLCAIQQPCPYTPPEAPAAVRFLVDELESCEESLDVILLPEYANCPATFSSGESVSFAKQHAEDLECTAQKTAARCKAIVALSYLAPIGQGGDLVYRNTTRVFDTLHFAGILPESNRRMRK